VTNNASPNLLKRHLRQAVDNAASSYGTANMHTGRHVTVVRTQTTAQYIISAACTIDTVTYQTVNVKNGLSDCVRFGRARAASNERPDSLGAYLDGQRQRRRHSESNYARRYYRIDDATQKIPSNSCLYPEPKDLFLYATARIDRIIQVTGRPDL
jgi:hypothetical protein